MHQAGHELSQPNTMEFFAKCIQRTMPKSYQQAWSAHTLLTAGGSQVPGDHEGQRSTNWRWPFGPVMIVAPFNFPLEIPTLQLMGALMMGNRPTLKCASSVSMVRLLLGLTSGLRHASR